MTFCHQAEGIAPIEVLVLNPLFSAIGAITENGLCTHYSLVEVQHQAFAPMEEFFNNKDLELSKTVQRLKHSRKTITGREVFLGQGCLYEHETLDYFNTDLKYNHQWHELPIFEYLGSEVNQIWHITTEITISLMTIFIGSKIIFCLVRVLLSIDMLRSDTNPVIALQPINPMGNLNLFII